MNDFFKKKLNLMFGGEMFHLKLKQTDSLTDFENNQDYLEAR